MSLDFWIFVCIFNILFKTKSQQISFEKEKAFKGYFGQIWKPPIDKQNNWETHQKKKNKY